MRSVFITLILFFVFPLSPDYDNISRRCAGLCYTRTYIHTCTVFSDALHNYKPAFISAASGLCTQSLRRSECCRGDCCCCCGVPAGISARHTLPFPFLNIGKNKKSFASSFTCCASLLASLSWSHLPASQEGSSVQLWRWALAL